MKKYILIFLITLSTLFLASCALNQTSVEDFNTEDALNQLVGTCVTYDDNSYSTYLPEMDLRFSYDVEQNSLLLEDGTTLSFAQNVDLERSENLLGAWVGSTYSYIDVQSNQTEEELYELGIRDEVFDIGNETGEFISQAMKSGALDCKFVSITIGKYKVRDEYIIYYRHIDTTENIHEYYVYRATVY